MNNNATFLSIKLQIDDAAVHAVSLICDDAPKPALIVRNTNISSKLKNIMVDYYVQETTLKRH